MAAVPKVTMEKHPVKIIIDTREPDPHPWPTYWPDGTQIVREGLETGDLCLHGNPDVVVERKTSEDFIGCLTAGRERFERELRRATHISAFMVIISGSLHECIDARRGLHLNGLLGTIAAWSRRYRHNIIFAGDNRTAAGLAYRFLAQPIREARELLKANEVKQ